VRDSISYLRRKTTNKYKKCNIEKYRDMV